MDDAVVLVLSLPCRRSLASLRACPGVSDTGLGANVRSRGAEPGGKVLAENSGTASLPTWTPGLCWGDGVSLDSWMLDGKGAYSFGGEGLVTLDAGAELAWLVADCVGVAGGGHDC